MIPMTYILAENYAEFRRLCDVLCVCPSYADWLSDKQDIAGKRIQFAFASENWIKNPKYDFDFIDRLKCACRTIFVEGDLP